jgi:hypothetical protein
LLERTQLQKKTKSKKVKQKKELLIYTLKQ